LKVEIRDGFFDSFNVWHYEVNPDYPIAVIIYQAKTKQEAIQFVEDHGLELEVN